MAELGQVQLCFSTLGPYRLSGRGRVAKEAVKRHNAIYVRLALRPGMLVANTSLHYISMTKHA